MSEALLLNDSNTVILMKMVHSSLETIRGLLGKSPESEESRAQMRQLEQLEQVMLDQASRLEAMNRVLEEFNYSVAHELFAPLRRISGFTQQIKVRFGARLDPGGISTLDSILESTQQMNELIDALMQLSRLSHVELEESEVDLSAMAGRIATELSLKEPGREVVLHIAPNLKATGDPGLLNIALGKLLDNAWKYTSQSPSARIEVGSLYLETQEVIFVRDNGIGFDMAESKRLFHPFQRLHDASLFPGTGLGLTAVKRIVERHGGRVWAEGARNLGATFYFAL